MARPNRVIAMVDDESLAAWRAAADESKLSLSTWMLLTLNAAMRVAAAGKGTRSKAA